eukprot:8267004-Prorocentrum_lima.AAC.1
MVADKVVGLTQFDTVEKVRSQVMELVAEEPMRAATFPQLLADVVLSLTHLRWIATLPTNPLTETIW